MQPNRQYKESTLQLRLSIQQKETLSLASKLRQVSLSQFVLENAYTAAQEIIGDQNHFVLSKDQWDQFCKVLDAPARKINSLNRLLNENGVLDDQ